MVTKNSASSSIESRVKNLPSSLTRWWKLAISCFLRSLKPNDNTGISKSFNFTKIKTEVSYCFAHFCFNRIVTFIDDHGITWRTTRTTFVLSETLQPPSTDSIWLFPRRVTATKYSGSGVPRLRKLSFFLVLPDHQSSSNIRLINSNTWGDAY